MSKRLENGMVCNGMVENSILNVLCAYRFKHSMRVRKKESETHTHTRSCSSFAWRQLGARKVI